MATVRVLPRRFLFPATALARRRFSASRSSGLARVLVAEIYFPRFLLLPFSAFRQASALRQADFRAKSSVLFLPFLVSAPTLLQSFAASQRFSARASVRFLLPGRVSARSF